jgi:hypothetical protein
MESIEEKKLRINRLLDLINNINTLIHLHKNRYEEGDFQVRQYRELKTRYERELLDILTKELDIQLPIAA